MDSRRHREGNRRREIRHRIQRHHSAVRDAVNEMDPMGLLQLGVPEDEYDMEIRRIADNLGRCKSVAEVVLLVRATFEKYFGDIAGIPENVWEEIARAIIKNSGLGAEIG